MLVLRCGVKTSSNLMVLASVLLEGVALAHSVRLEYSAPVDCPDSGAFEARVEERLVRSRLAAPAQLAWTYVVRIRRGDAGYDGELAFVNAEGERSQSRVSGGTCSEVFDAVVVSTVLAIESNAVDRGESRPPTPSHEAQSMPAVENPSSVASAPAVAPPIAPSPISPASPALPDRRAAPRALPSHLAIGVQAGLNAGFAPEPAPGVGLFVEARNRQGWTARIGAAYATSGEVVERERSARFALVAGRVDGCTPPLELSPANISFCLMTEAGGIRADGKGGDDIARTASEWAPWLAPGAGPRLELLFGSRVALLARMELLVPLSRERFVYQSPEVMLHEVPPVTWSGAMGGSCRF
jgi:hypothetical protein